MALTTLLTACQVAAPAAPGPTPSTSSSPSPPAEVNVAFIYDSSPEGSLERTLPALQGIELAFATAALQSAAPVAGDLVPLDTRGVEASAAEIAAEIAGDPAFVAVFAAPDLPGQHALVRTLSAAGVPVLSLSARDSVQGAAPGTWLRFVVPVRSQAEALARSAASLPEASAGVCFLPAPTDGTVYSNVARRVLADDIEVVDVADAAEAAEAGCGVVMWGGDAVRGAALATELDATGPNAPVLIGGPDLRNPEFLELAGDAAEGAISVCSCADVSTSLDLAAQRFIQDYQSEYGSPPGPYAVEAWDAAHLLIRALRGGGSTREEIVAWLARTSSADGLGGSYAFRAGELADPESALHRYRVEGGRWIELSSTDDA